MSIISAGTTVGTALVNTGDTTGNLVFKTGSGATTALTISGTDQSITVAGGLNLGAPVAIASGGTGQTTATAAFNALNPMTTTGDMLYEASPTTAARLAIGSTGQVLTVSGGIPAWSAPAGGPNPLHGDQVFTSSGTFTVPAGVTAVKVTAIGASGNGGTGFTSGCSCNQANGGGGGAGGYIVDYVAVTAGASVSVTVGTNAGTRTSSFVGTTTLTAAGGSNGGNASSSTTGTLGLSGASTIFGQTFYTPGYCRSNDALSGAFCPLVTSGTYRDGRGSVYEHGFGTAGAVRSASAGSTSTYIPIGIGAGAGGGNGQAQTGGGTGVNGLVIVEW